jgi:hypothetical protein
VGQLDGTGLIDLTHANAIVPALAVALAALIALGRHRAGEGRGWLALGLALGLAVPLFQVFVAAQLVLGLGVALLTCRSRAGAGLLALGVLAGLLPLVLGRGGEAVALRLAPLAVARLNRELLDLSPLGGPALLAWAGLWVLACLGLRVLGVAALVRAIASRLPERVALATMAAAGWPLALLVHVGTLEPPPGRPIVNEAEYFVRQSGPLLWIFAALFFDRLRLSPLRLRLVVCACALCALPSVLDDIGEHRRTPPGRIPAAVVRAVAAFERDSRSGAVLLEPPLRRFYPPPAVVLAGRRVAFTRYIPYLQQFAARADVLARRLAVERFYATDSPQEAAAIAARLGATHVLTQGGRAPRVSLAGVAEVVFEGEDVRVYRLRAASPTR